MNRLPIPSAACQRRCGFTLVELVIVIALMGILAAAATPKFANSLIRYRALAAADRIAGDVIYARQVAITSGSPTTVTFDVGTNSYSMTGVTDPNHPGQAYLVDLDNTPYPAVLDTVSLGLGGLGNAVTFDIFGRPDYGGSITVDSGGEQETVDIDPDHGRATVQ